MLAGHDDPTIRLVNPRIVAGLIPHARLPVYSGGHVELVLQPALLAPLSGPFLTEPAERSAGR